MVKIKNNTINEISFSISMMLQYVVSLSHSSLHIIASRLFLNYKIDSVINPSSNNFLAVSVTAIFTWAYVNPPCINAI